MTIDNVTLNKTYWVVDESATEGNEVFVYKFKTLDELRERWDWSVFESKSSAEQYAVNLSR